MLDQNISEQLKTVFANLKNEISLVYIQSEHAKQTELVEMLNDVAGTSDKIKVVASDKTASYPQFEIFYKGQPNGIRFNGIPGGHEFTSLIVAILNSDGLGKMPDAMIIDRIKGLKGPIHIKTYISLSCENCPQVVQALNLMATLKDDFTHEMIDGEFVPEDINNLKIQGVPSVIHQDQMISSGKTSLMELIEKLENTFGKSDESSLQKNKDLGLYDVVVVGAGPAGVSSAIYSARKGLKVVIITDRLGGQLQDTKGIENLISVPYTEGPELSDRLHKHMKEYDIQILEHRRVEAVEPGNPQNIKLTSGEYLQAKSLIIATGAKWRELNVTGEKEYLGRGVAFCPHCDGPYYKGKDIAVVGGGNSGVEAAIDLSGIVKSVTLIEFNEELKADEVLVKKLKSIPNVKIIKNARTHQVMGNGEKVIGLEYENRKTQNIEKIDLDGIFVQIGLIPNSSFLKGLVEMNKYGEILIDNKCKTSQPGIYAAGDVTNIPYKQIVVALGEGAKAALSAFEDQMVS